ncbi:MAG: hypothetical protein CVV30_10750 [Methanomicrobiales archaeon HGW-Methanomicrobiales-1]|jgi:hypothetical protein|nr:MAG: hypothetical protein CVV30_10750 [Methanomicrobiales archaeon HGW-Methanomicrobiales-1]
MDNDQANYIRHRLQRYEESIRETQDHFDHLESFGSYRACAPCYEKFGIPHLIEALKNSNGMEETFWQEYDRISGKLAAFTTSKGQIYRDMLYADLKNYVAAYHSALCYADLNMITLESDHDLFNREAIRALIAELHGDYDTRDIEILVTALDESFLRMKETTEGTCLKKSQVPAHPSIMAPITRKKPFSVCGENDPKRQI